MCRPASDCWLALTCEWAADSEPRGAWARRRAAQAGALGAGVAHAVPAWGEQGNVTHNSIKASPLLSLLVVVLQPSFGKVTTLKTLRALFSLPVDYKIKIILALSLPKIKTCTFASTKTTFVSTKYVRVNTTEAYIFWWKDTEWFSTVKNQNHNFSSRKKLHDWESELHLNYVKALKHKSYFPTIKEIIEMTTFIDCPTENTDMSWC